MQSDQITGKTSKLLEGQITPKIPKQVQLARAKLGDLEINSDNVKNLLSKTEYNNLANSFRNSMGPEAKKAYGELASDTARRDWLTSFVLDPQFATVEGWNRTFAYNDNYNQADDEWVSLAVLAGPMYCNSAEDAEAVSKDLESRPSRYPTLRARGDLEYKFVREKTTRKNGNRDEGGTSASSELKEEENKLVTEDLRRGCANVSAIGKHTKRKAIKQREPESEETKKLKQASSLKQSAIRKTKTLIDKFSTEIEACIEALDKVKAKGYPPSDEEIGWKPKPAAFRSCYSPARRSMPKRRLSQKFYTQHLKWWKREPSRSKPSCPPLRRITRTSRRV